VSNLLFFRRSLATHHAAVETMRRARAMPPGPERLATRRFARALSELAKTEAWLEGQAPRQRASAFEQAGRGVGSPEADFEGHGSLMPGAGWREPRSLFGET
jgi:hypothetical protein